MKRKILLADIFCGAGGTSQGACEALEMLGYKPELTAINHWPVAVATHSKNHPNARHLCTSVDDVNPLSLYKEGELELLWASPECTHHSVARGGKPASDQSRATAWCVVRWAQALAPKIILVENVPEFVSWGGLGNDGRPLKAKKGQTFRAWKSALESLGYRVDYKILCAADYGDPTTRKRLFVQAVRGRRRIVWPNPTHHKYPVGKAKGWVGAREIIDWSIPSQSIYERERPLVSNTLDRIFEWVIKSPISPFIVGLEHTGANGNETRSVDEPLSTVSAHARKALVEPFLIELRGTNHEQIKRTAQSIDEPLSTVCGGRHHGLVEPFLVCLEHGGRTRSIDRPLPTVTTAKGGAISLVEPFLLQSTHSGRLHSISDPLATVCGNRGDIALCEPAIIPQQSSGRLRPVSEPMPTVSCAGSIALIEPALIEYYGTGGSSPVSQPMKTVTCKARFGLVQPDVLIDGKLLKLDLKYRMLRPHELAGAQGFKKSYIFTGNITETVKQIGNAVPRRLARAIVAAVVSQSSDISDVINHE